MEKCSDQNDDNSVDQQAEQALVAEALPIVKLDDIPLDADLSSPNLTSLPDELKLNIFRYLKPQD